MGSDIYVLDINRVKGDDLQLVGGKALGLGNLYRQGVKVPEGFIVTTDAYSDFMKQTNLNSHIMGLLNDLNTYDMESLVEVSTKIKRSFMDSDFPETISEKIVRAYISYGEGLVAVRSSATAEDLPKFSFAGQQSSFLNLVGSRDVVKHVQQCWASLFEPRAMFYRHQNGMDQIDIAMAVIVQDMVQPDCSGVLFTVDPVSGDTESIVIDAVLGLGESLVSGYTDPDHYVLEKSSLIITEKYPSKQEWMLTRDLNGESGTGETNIWVKVSVNKQNIQKLTDIQIVVLAGIGREIEEMFDNPQDIEWAKEGEDFYIVQSRPVTTL